MRISFLPGGRLNELGPFNPGEVIEVQESVALQLINDGLASEIQPPSRRAITVTLIQKSEGKSNA